MIAKSTQITLLSSIDKLAFRKGHEIEMFDALIIIRHHATTEAELIDDLSDILVDEIIRIKICISS